MNQTLFKILLEVGKTLISIFEAKSNERKDHDDTSKDRKA